MRRNNLIFNMSLIAVFSALSFVVTAFLAVPIASGAGYLNFQDCIIFALASLIHPLVGGIVGGLTGMLADIYAGYASFAVYTLVIKFVEGVVAGYMFRLLTKVINNENKGFLIFKLAASFLVGGILMALGYMIPDFVNFASNEVVLLDLGFNTLQACVNVVIGTLLYLALYKVRDVIVKRGEVNG